MKIIAVDTSTTSCSVAIVDNDSLLAEMTIAREQTHSKHLMDIIHTVVAFSGLAISAVDGFAVTRGPGTFTGLRIGISTVKGLAAASGKPIVGVSSLDALAEQCACPGYLICPLIDARKGEVYFSRYRLQENILKKETEEQVLPPDQAVGGIAEPALLVGSGALLYRDVLAKTMEKWMHFAPGYHHTIRASSVARLSLRRFEKKDTDDVGALTPHYIRNSDAQLNLKK